MSVQKATGKKYTSLTFINKLDILKRLELGESKKDILKEFNCSTATLNRIILKKDSIRKNQNLTKKRLRTGAHKNVEEALSVWVQDMRSKQATINGPILMDKAREIALMLNVDFKPSNGWLDRWKKRENIQSFKNLSESVSDNKITCRVCLQEALVQGSLSIFDEGSLEQEWSIARVIQQHLCFKPISNDDLSTVICRICWTKLNDFHQFYLSVETAHRVLGYTKLAEEGEYVVNAKTEPAQPVAEELIYEINIKEEMMEHHIWHENVALPMHDEEVEAENNSTIEEITTNNPLHEAEVKTEDTKLTLSSVLIGKSKRAKKTLSEESAPDSCGDVVSSPKRRQIRLTFSANDDDVIKKHISMGCELCTFVGDDFAQMSKHFRIAHKDLKPYVMCCGRKLNKHTKVLQHAYKHEDPEFFKCDQCQKIFANGYVLRTHKLANHAPEEELTYVCEQCPRKFSRRYLLELHRPSHIPVNERQFQCEKCPHAKAFASEHLLQIHISMRHTRATNVCHVCAKEIRDNQAFEKHVRLHFQDSGPRVKCPRPDCDRWLKDEDNLKQHMRRHKDDGQIFTCDECGKVCKNRRSLRSHLNYAHSNEVFTCEECNKTFKKAITLKEHMAQHTGETLYKCPFCERTFNSNANMHSHKKKMHPIEWDNWRKTKRGSSQQVLSANKLLMATTSQIASSNSGNGEQESPIVSIRNGDIDPFETNCVLDGQSVSMSF